jgi:hypothetical protein
LSRDDLTAYPLVWPRGWARTLPNQRIHAPRLVAHSSARFAVSDALLLGHVDQRSVVISTNLPVAQLYGSGEVPIPDDPGVAVYWTDHDGQDVVLACDAWTTVTGNLWSLADAIAPICQLLLLGVPQITNRVLRSFAAFPTRREEAHA